MQSSVARALLPSAPSPSPNNTDLSPVHRFFSGSPRKRVERCAAQPSNESQRHQTNDPGTFARATPFSAALVGFYWQRAFLLVPELLGNPVYFVFSHTILLASA
eukprot:CAMPEP_0113959734 /NCGR_PEP_ID=MMETSP0011_2-20120614/4314_1 /TAXON_ID=101924 /ORGANISM="Rhodosorus marinus" /LENGTH=103 /DNA_ID=CAMNT_0000971089 /DNA_START=542 /DNA_END=853 /DNA_ORIENTATION=+ /assembly_acc=CAM_ASM_000156